MTRRTKQVDRFTELPLLISAVQVVYPKPGTLLGLGVI